MNERCPTCGKKRKQTAEEKKAKQKVINRRWYLANKTKILAKTREREKTPEGKKEKKERMKIYRKKHPEILKAQKRRYFLKHKDSIYAKKRAARAAKKKVAENILSTKPWIPLNTDWSLPDEHIQVSKKEGKNALSSNRTKSKDFVQRNPDKNRKMH